MSPAAQRDFLPSLRFHRLTPVFDAVVGVAARDGAIKRRLLDVAGLRPGMRVLDVGCGTGTLAAAAARSVGALEIIGLDADPVILGKARRRAQSSGLQVAFVEGRSTELPFPDASFDAVLSTLFFHHLPDADKRVTAREILRVLRPGGPLAVADVGRPQDPAMRLLVRATVQLVDGTATTALNVGGGLPGVLTAAGWEEVRTRDRIRTPTGTYELLTATAPG